MARNRGTAKAEFTLKVYHGSGFHISNAFSTSEGMPLSVILFVHQDTDSGLNHWSACILSNPKRTPGQLEAKFKVTRIINAKDGSVHSLAGKEKTLTIAYNQASKAVLMSERKTVIMCGCTHTRLVEYKLFADIVWEFHVPMSAAATNSGDLTPSDPEYVIKKLENLMSTQCLTDMVFVVEEEEIPAHRLILAAMSAVFRSMFSWRTTEETTGRIEVKDATAAGIKRMLRCVYTSWEPEWTGTTDEDLLELAYLAHKYELEPLLAHCEYRMIQTLSVHNVCKMVKAASYLNMQSVMVKSGDIIIANKPVLESQEWKIFVNDHPRIANEVYMMVLVRCL